jgi:hypothetical protein
LTWDLGAREGTAPKQKRQKFNLRGESFWKIVFEKLVFKFFYICLLLEKLINKKHFSVNEKHFSVKKTWLGFQESVFLLFRTENIL